MQSKTLRNACLSETRNVEEGCRDLDPFKIHLEVSFKAWSTHLDKNMV